MIAHVGAITTQETVELAEHAAAFGVAAISAITPYYFALPEQALVEHFCRCRRSCGRHAHVPLQSAVRAGNHVTPSCAEAVIARCPNVIWHQGQLRRPRYAVELFGLKGGKFQVACGSDALLLRGFRQARSVGVSGNANVFPEVLVGLFEAFWRGDLAAAARQQETLDLIRATLQDGRHLALYKCILETRGLALWRHPVASAAGIHRGS